MIVDDGLVNRIVVETGWYPETARLGLRANFRCEYCNLDFLASPENYKLIQVDHIIPVSRQGSTPEFDNLALACTQCNFSFKRKFDPRTTAPKDASRDELIQAGKEYIQKVKTKTANEIALLKSILGSNH